MLLFCIFIIISYVSSIETEYGKIVGDLPTRIELFSHHYNMARISPRDYINIYGWDILKTNTLAVQASNYPGTNPLWVKHQLCNAARYQSKDLKLNCPQHLSHNSCDGTSQEERNLRFYPCYIGELGARGYLTGDDMINGALCEKLCSNNCCDDGTNDDRRKVAMSSKIKVMGCGYYMAYQFISFSNCSNGLTEKDHPIYSGIHQDFNKTHSKFMVIFHHKELTTINSKTLYILDGRNSETIALTLEFGKNTSGHFYGISKKKGWGCRQYYFEFKSGSLSYRFPQHGNYFTTDENSNCTRRYIWVDFPVDTFFKVVNGTFLFLPILIAIFLVIGIIVIIVVLIISCITTIYEAKPWRKFKKRWNKFPKLQNKPALPSRKPSLPSKKPNIVGRMYYAFFDQMTPQVPFSKPRISRVYRKAKVEAQGGPKRPDKSNRPKKKTLSIFGTLSYLQPPSMFKKPKRPSKKPPESKLLFGKNYKKKAGRKKKPGIPLSKPKHKYIHSIDKI